MVRIRNVFQSLERGRESLAKFSLTSLVPEFEEKIRSILRNAGGMDSDPEARERCVAQELNADAEALYREALQWLQLMKRKARTTKEEEGGGTTIPEAV
ncbi:MAG: hypothetical protein COU08_03280 [Candidatus Harrisonbacteria bacterium CG10_big_fil_rev_8_21_14_0_10_42_17]|uniref:Uncharacterized protein n=1 Tax=Candidatus Harrisonbacteria bacterium CG10_big_fil_rev_8_21_14_0_10_42_17 TaxID=1974584 RepID=A0A2M6WHN9_9BACT|nr:MAG: hypothetical protein COU08_03280 [Candidatus Harrisonbacteria bacterium CG10_big_fil_rev_8_21_14_0_10_42_17]